MSLHTIVGLGLLTLGVFGLTMWFFTWAHGEFVSNLNRKSASAELGRRE